MSSRVLAGTDRRPTALFGALGASGLSAALLAAGAVVPVVEGADRGFTSTPLLVVLALLPVALAAALVLSGRENAAAGVLTGVAALAPGRAVLDLQFVTDPAAAVRPELYLPADLLEHSPGTGLWLLVAGHAAGAAAGLLAVRAARQRADLADAGERESADEGVARWRQRWLFAVVLAAVVAAFGLLMAPFSSSDVYLLARNAFEGPVVAMAGYLLVACALPLAAALFMTSGNGAFARGGLGGLAAGAAGLAVPSLAAGVSIAAASVSPGPVVVLVAVAVLPAVALARVGTRVEPERAEGRSGEVNVPGRRWLQTATGVFAVLTAAAAAGGSFAAQLSTSGTAPPPESPARWLLLCAGLLVAALGLAMFVPRAAVLVRPVLSVTWAGVLLAGTTVLDTAITATGVPGGTLSAGPGVFWTWLAMCGAAITACCSVVTGVVEREDAEGLDEPAGEARQAGLNLLTPVSAAAVLAIAAFGSPVLSAPDYIASGLWSDFGTPSWGLLTALLVVLGAAALAPRSRPAPAAGVLVGAACLLGLHAAMLPLSSGRIPGASAGLGLWFALAGVVALLAAAVIAIAGRRRTSG